MFLITGVVPHNEWKTKAKRRSRIECRSPGVIGLCLIKGQSYGNESDGFDVWSTGALDQYQSGNRDQVTSTSDSFHTDNLSTSSELCTTNKCHTQLANNSKQITTDPTVTNQPCGINFSDFKRNVIGEKLEENNYFRLINIYDTPSDCCRSLFLVPTGKTQLIKFGLGVCFGKNKEKLPWPFSFLRHKESALKEPLSSRKNNLSSGTTSRRTKKKRAKNLKKAFYNPLLRTFQSVTGQQGWKP